MLSRLSNSLRAKRAMGGPSKKTKTGSKAKTGKGAHRDVKQKDKPKEVVRPSLMFCKFPECCKPTCSPATLDN